MGRIVASSNCAVAVAVPLILALASCVIAEPPSDIPTPAGFAQGALVTCGVCLDRPFCFNEATNEFTERSPSTAPCVAPSVGSVPATRVDTATSRSGEFHCLPEPGKNFAPT